VQATAQLSVVYYINKKRLACKKGHHNNIRAGILKMHQISPTDSIPKGATGPGTEDHPASRFSNPLSQIIMKQKSARLLKDDSNEETIQPR
jgi:hypothetical protein